MIRKLKARGVLIGGIALGLIAVLVVIVTVVGVDRPVTKAANTSSGITVRVFAHGCVQDDCVSMPLPGVKLTARRNGKTLAVTQTGADGTAFIALSTNQGVTVTGESTLLAQGTFTIGPIQGSAKISDNSVTLAINPAIQDKT